MTSSVPPAGGLPFSDVSSRMAVFGRLFSEEVGIPGPTAIPTASELVRVVRSRVPRRAQADDDSPLFEAAAFVGEWLRGRAPARWIAERSLEPYLQVEGPERSVVYLLPLVSVLRTASTAGYDGLASILDRVLDDIGEPPAASSLDDIRVRPRAESSRVAAWVRARADDPRAFASLWRRCQLCSTIVDDSLDLPGSLGTWETQAATAAESLAMRPFECGCGGPPGAASRFLMMRTDDGTRKLADIHVSGSFTRVACWELHGERILPHDATALAVQESKQ